MTENNKFKTRVFDKGDEFLLSIVCIPHMEVISHQISTKHQQALKLQGLLELRLTVIVL